MFGLGTGEVLIIFVLALVFIGPKKLPELARSLGKSWREFQRAKDELMAEVQKSDDNPHDNVHAERMKHLETDLAQVEKDKAANSQLPEVELPKKEETPPKES